MTFDNLLITAALFSAAAELLALQVA